MKKVWEFPVCYLSNYHHALVHGALKWLIIVVDLSLHFLFLHGCCLCLHGLLSVRSRPIARRWLRRWPGTWRLASSWPSKMPRGEFGVCPQLSVLNYQFCFWYILHVCVFIWGATLWWLVGCMDGWQSESEIMIVWKWNHDCGHGMVWKWNLVQYTGSEKHNKHEFECWSFEWSNNSKTLC